MVVMVVALLIVEQMPVTAMAHGMNNEHSRKTNETGITIQIIIVEVITINQSCIV